MFQDLLLFNVADGDTRRFLEEFDRLAAWVDNSLDMYKVSRWCFCLRKAGMSWLHGVPPCHARANTVMARHAMLAWHRPR